MTSFGFQPFAQIAAERVINSIPLGLLIAGIAWLLLRVIGKQSSGMRYSVWFSTLLAVVALPFRPLFTVPSTAIPAAHVILPGFWAVGAFAFWILIATLAATRIVMGLLKLREVRSHCMTIAASTLPQPLEEMVEQFRAIRKIEVCSSSRLRVPTAIGFFKPRIVIPEWALQELSAEELKIVLLHEFAHLRRWDDWTNLAQKFLTTLFFFHPAVWWIEKRLSLEREMACDEAVLAETENPRAYANCLVVLAEKSLIRRGLAMAQAAISHAGETSLRLARILDDRPSATWSFKPAMGALAVCLVAGGVAATGAPVLIAFKNAAPAPTVRPVSVASRQVAAAAAMARVASLPDAGKRQVASRVVYRQARLNSTTAAKLKQLSPRAPALVRIAAKPRETELFVVTETAAYDGQGLPMWRVCVWRVRLATQTEDAIERGIIANSL